MSKLIEKNTIYFIRKSYYGHTQLGLDVSGTSPEDPLKNIDNLMKKVFFRCNSSGLTHLLLLFTGTTNMQKF